MKYRKGYIKTLLMTVANFKTFSRFEVHYCKGFFDAQAGNILTIAEIKVGHDFIEKVSMLKEIPRKKKAAKSIIKNWSIEYFEKHNTSTFS